MPPCLHLVDRLPAVLHQVLPRARPGCSRNRLLSYDVRCVHQKIVARVRALNHGFPSYESHRHHRLETQQKRYSHSGITSEPENDAAAIELILAGYEATTHDPGENRSGSDEPTKPAAVRKVAHGHRRSLETRLRRMQKNSARLASKSHTKTQQSLRGQAYGRHAMNIKRGKVFWDAHYRRATTHTTMVQTDIRRGLFRAVVGGWTTKFAYIYNQVNGAQTRPKYKPPKLHALSANWSSEILQCVDEGAIESFVYRKSLEIKRPPYFIWTQAALWLLYSNRCRALDLMKATHSLPFVPTQCVNDAVVYLAGSLQEDTENSERDKRRLWDLIESLSLCTSGKKFAFEGTAVMNLVKVYNVEQISALHSIIKAKKISANWHSILHLATALAKRGRFEEALDALLESGYSGADLTSTAFKSVCATLLRQATTHPDGLRMCLRIVPNLVHIGVQLNTQLCNIIMLNAAEAGDLNTTFEIYRSLRRYSVKSDKHTYAILLKAWKTSADDAHMLNEIIRNAILDIDLQKSPVVAVEVMHCLAIHHTKYSRANCYELVLGAYLQFYEPRTLVKLGLPIPDTVSAVPRTKEPSMPPPKVVHILLHTYLFSESKRRFLRKSRHTVLHARKCCARFLALARDNVYPFTEMAAYPHVFNSLLLGLVQHPSGLWKAGELINVMERSRDPERGGLPHSCPPDVQSYSIIAMGFAKDQHTRKAEETVEFMLRKGLQPNAVTWNTILLGHIYEDNLEGVRAALRKLREGGLEGDGYTKAAMDMINERPDWLDRLEVDQPSSPMDFTDKLKLGLKDRITEIPALEAKDIDKQLGDDESDIIAREYFQ